MDSKTFRNALGRFAAGVTVITTRTADGTDHGMTATAFSSVSLDPPLVLICVGKKAFAHGHIEAAGSFTVNVLGAAQEALSDRFAHRIKTEDGYVGWPNDRDKFEDLDLQRAPSGNAMLAGNLVTIDCDVEEALPGGDHTIFIGRVQHLELADDDEQTPLLFFKGQYKTTA